MSLASESSCLCPHPHRYAFVNSKDDPALLRKILADPRFPEGVDVFTHELSLTGARWGPGGHAAIRKCSTSQGQNLSALARPFRDIAKAKDLRIWLGHVWSVDGKLFNAYSLVCESGIQYTQRKKFLWRGEKWLFSAPEKWEGLFGPYAMTICSEASAFYNPLGWSRPTSIPEMREEKVPMVVIPAHWVKNKVLLLNIARTMARPYEARTYAFKSEKYRGRVCEKGIRPEGSLVAIVNSMECAVVEPVLEAGRRKSRVIARLKQPGWIEFFTGQAQTRFY